MRTALVLDCPSYRLSRHAAARMRERGIRAEEVSQLLQHADRERHVGDDCYALACSSVALAEARRNGTPRTILDCLATLVVILAGDGTVVTVMNRATRIARFQRGHACLSARERARMAARRRRGGGYR